MKIGDKVEVVDPNSDHCGQIGEVVDNSDGYWDIRINIDGESENLGFMYDEVSKVEVEVEEDKQNKSATDKQVGGAWYKKYDIQPIEFVMENEDALHPTDAFMLNNVLKYCLRHREKNGEEDLEKAKHYIDLVKEHTYSDEE